MQDRIAFVAGTRPELIKLAPVINLTNAYVIFTGQHYDKNMSDDFFNLIKCDEFINLNFDQKGIFDHTKDMSKKIQSVLKETVIDKVVVQGDTNTTLAGAVASKLQNKFLYYIESGMRSYDVGQIEEYNRVIVSHLADINFCNHNLNKDNLIKENINPQKIIVTGSTVYSSVMQIDLDKEKINDKEYILLTLHRPENVDDKDRLNSLMEAINSLNFFTIFPIHPRTKKMINSEENNYENISFIDPQDYESFLNLINHSKFIISDSGGVQEEASILRKPLLIPRNYTERPEMLEKFNLLTPTPKNVTDESIKLINGESKLISNIKNSDLLYGKDEVVASIVHNITS